MKVLIIEDEPNKLSLLREFLSSEFPAAEISTAGSYRGGLDAMLESNFDVVLMDMALPTYEKSFGDDAEFRFFGGKEILRQMQRRKLQTPVIVVTMFESFGRDGEKKSLTELKKDLEARHQSNYKGTVYFSASLGVWKAQLKTLMSSAIAGERGNDRA